MNSSIKYFLIMFSVLALLGFFTSISDVGGNILSGVANNLLSDADLINLTGNLILPDYDYDPPRSDNDDSDNSDSDNTSNNYTSVEGVERYLPASVSGVSEFDVNLFVKLPAENQAFLIDETFPSGFELVDARGADSSEPNHLKWVYYNSAAEEISLSYRLKSPDSVAGFNFSGDFVFEDLVLQEIGGTTLLNVTFADLCEGKTDGSSCGVGSYCCGGVCNTAPTNCPDCQVSGACCSGTKAICCNEPSTVECGTNSCPAPSCGAEGNNTFISYSSACENFCSGSGFCDTCECESEEVVCGTSAVCDVEYECIPCASDKLNCDLDIENGCETNYLIDSENCGDCGNQCSAGYYCAEGECKKGTPNASGANAENIGASQNQDSERGFSLTDPLSLLLVALVLSAVSTAGYVALKKMSASSVSSETVGSSYSPSPSAIKVSSSGKSFKEKLAEKAAREKYSESGKNVSADSEKDKKVKEKLSDLKKNLKAIQDNLKDM